MHIETAKNKLTEGTESINNAGCDVLIQEVSYKAPDIFAILNLARDYQMRLCVGNTSHAEPINNVEVVTVWYASINTFRVHEVKFTWTTFWI